MNSPDPASPTPVTAGAIPFYRSPQYILAMSIVVGGACAFFPALGAILKKDQISVLDFVEIIGAAIALLGGGAAWIIRQISKLQPITLTQKGATAAPATLARIETTIAMNEAGITPSGVRAAQIQTAQDATAKSLKDISK
jgi:hypothetical protein